jgi:putative glutathione S-transferase
MTEIHKPGTNDGWHGEIREGGDFAPEKDRYHLYIGKGPSVINGI